VRSNDLRQVWWKPLRNAVSRTTSSASGVLVRLRKADGEYTVTVSASEATQQTSTEVTELQDCNGESCNLVKVDAV